MIEYDKTPHKISSCPTTTTSTNIDPSLAQAHTMLTHTSNPADSDNTDHNVLPPQSGTTLSATSSHLTHAQQSGLKMCEFVESVEHDPPPQRSNQVIDLTGDDTTDSDESSLLSSDTDSAYSDGNSYPTDTERNRRAGGNVPSTIDRRPGHTSQTSDSDSTTKLLHSARRALGQTPRSSGSRQMTSHHQASGEGSRQDARDEGPRGRGGKGSRVSGNVDGEEVPTSKKANKKTKKKHKRERNKINRKKNKLNSKRRRKKKEKEKEDLADCGICQEPLSTGDANQKEQICKSK